MKPIFYLISFAATGMAFAQDAAVKSSGGDIMESVTVNWG